MREEHSVQAAHEYGTVVLDEADVLDAADQLHASLSDSSSPHSDVGGGGTACDLFGDRTAMGLSFELESGEGSEHGTSKYGGGAGMRGELHQQQAPSSFCGSIFGTNMSIIANTVNALLGVSIFAMPWGFEQAGLLGGAATILLVAPLSYETARVLLVAQRMIYHSTGVVKNYPEIASDILGKNWAVVVKSATVISCLGGCVGYLIFLGEVCGQLFDLPLETAILGAVLPLMLLSWIRSFRDLAVFTLIGVFAIVVSCGVVMIDGVQAMKSQPPDAIHPQLLTLRSAPNFLGPATFLFTIHYCVLSMGAETLQQHESSAAVSVGVNGAADKAMAITSSPTERRKATSAASGTAADLSISRPLAISYALSSLLIILVGSSGYFTYGAADIVKDSEGLPQPGCESHVCQNIIMNLSPGPLRDFAGFALVVAIVLSYVIILVPAREHIELIVLRCVLFSTTLLSHSRMRMRIALETHPLRALTLHPFPTPPPQRHRYFDADSWTSELGQSYFINFIRSSLVFMTALVAVLAPYFGTVLGAVGGLTDALQSFVLPPLIALKLLHHRGSFTQYFYRGIVIWGLFTILYTLLKTARSIAVASRDFLV